MKKESKALTDHGKVSTLVISLIKSPTSTSLLTPKSTRNKKKSKFYFAYIEKLMVPCKSTAEEVSFEWTHHRISSTDLKVRTTRHVSIIDSGSERVKQGS